MYRTRMLLVLVVMSVLCTNPLLAADFDGMYGSFLATSYTLGSVHLDLNGLRLDYVAGKIKEVDVKKKVDGARTLISNTRNVLKGYLETARQEVKASVSGSPSYFAWNHAQNCIMQFINSSYSLEQAAMYITEMSSNFRYAYEQGGLYLEIAKMQLDNASLRWDLMKQVSP